MEGDKLGKSQMSCPRNKLALVEKIRASTLLDIVVEATDRSHARNRDSFIEAFSRRIIVRATARWTASAKK